MPSEFPAVNQPFFARRFLRVGVARSVTALARRVLGVSARAVGDLAAMDWNFQGPFDLDQSGPHGKSVCASSLELESHPNGAACRVSTAFPLAHDSISIELP